MIAITGGAGFIGSCLLSKLNNENITDIIIVDNIRDTEKWKYLVGKKYLEYIHKSDFLNWLEASEQSDAIDVIIHLGACSSTTEKNFDYLYINNFDYSKRIWNWCLKKNKRMVYASSAATYGDGTNGFCDNLELLHSYKPLNGYGYSKHLFDLWVRKQIVCPPQFVGLKFFNVYGPNEYHKGSMASVIYHSFNQIKETGSVKLFKSYRNDIKDGEQSRDFIYVKDIVNIIYFMINNNHISGIFNAGTGKARSFNDLVKATFNSLGKEPNIEYIDMPIDLRQKYQYYTEANINSLINTGYNDEFYSLESGIEDYVNKYLVSEGQYL